MSLGFKIYSYFNGNLVHQDSLGNKFYQDKKNPNKTKDKKQNSKLHTNYLIDSDIQVISQRTF